MEFHVTGIILGTMVLNFTSESGSRMATSGTALRLLLIYLYVNLDQLIVTKEVHPWTAAANLLPVWIWTNYGVEFLMMLISQALPQFLVLCLHDPPLS